MGCKIFIISFLFFIFYLLAGEGIVYGQTVNRQEATGNREQAKGINRTDERGRKQGYWRKVDGNGHLKYEGKFIDNIAVDTFKYYYLTPNPSPNGEGKIESICVYTNGGQNIKTRMLYENGKIKCEGYYRGNSQEARGNSKYLRDSIWKYYNERGGLIGEEFYKNNNKYGIWKTYYDNGRVEEEISWKGNVKEGIWKQYFEDGVLKLSMNYKNDLFDGQYKVFYPSGIILISGIYKDGLKEGKWLYYGEMGQIEKIEDYKDGKLLKQEKK